MFKSILRTLFRTGTHTSATQKLSNGLEQFRVRPSFEMFEERITPSATYFDYGGRGVVIPTVVPQQPSQMTTVTLSSPTPSAGNGLVVTKVITPIDTNNDLNSYEQAQFSVECVSDVTVTVALLVYRKIDDALPPTAGYSSVTPAEYKAGQSLLSFDIITLQKDQSATLTVNLPACNYQLDATVVPGGTLGLDNPIGYQTAYDGNLDSGIGTNACPDFLPHSRGYWVNHTELWPADGLSLGSVMYTKEQLVTILNTPVRGNGALALAQQEIASKLNFYAGADPTQSIFDAVNQADSIFGNNCMFTTSTSIAYTSFTVATSTTSSLVTILGAWNIIA